MITKGVASVPSPVRNLVEWSPSFDHDAFVSRVAEEFADVYGGSTEPIVSPPYLGDRIGTLLTPRRRAQRVDERELEHNKHAKELSDTMQVSDNTCGQVYPDIVMSKTY